MPILHISHVFKEREKRLSEKNYWCFAKIHSEFYSWKMQEGRNVGKKAKCEKLCRKIVEKIDLTGWKRRKEGYSNAFVVYRNYTKQKWM